MMKEKSQGILVFDPVPLTGSADKMFKPGWMLVSVRCDIDKYYRWFLKKRHGIELMMPAWGPHISVLRGEGTRLTTEQWQYFKDKYDGQKIEFEYEISPKTNGRHWWLRVICDKLKDIREEMGLRRDGKWGLHLTLGMPHPLNLDHSYYIWELFKKGII